MPESRCVLGMRAGLSGTGVDAALLELVGVGLNMTVRLRLGANIPYPPELRESLEALSLPETGLQKACLHHRILGEVFAQAARQMVDRAGFSMHKLQCLGCEFPTAWMEHEGKYPAAIEIGMAACVAERTGVTTVSEFVNRQLVLSAQGMWTAPLADYLLFRSETEDRVLIHLGSTAQVLFLPAGARPEELEGSEAAPCNQLLDGLIRQLSNQRERFDAGGKLAVQGHCFDALLEQWAAHPYFHKRGPKALPRSAFGSEFIGQATRQGRSLGCSPHDVLCTATHLVAREVANACTRLGANRPGERRILVSGGGGMNGLLWRLIEQQLAGRRLERTESVGVPSDWRRAMGIGVSAALTLDGVPGNLTRISGATGSRLLGSITPGSPSNWSNCLTWMAAQASPDALALAWG